AALAIEAQDLAHQVPELTRLALRAGSRALERIQRIGAAERDREQRVDSVHLAAVLALEELLLELDLPDPVGDLVAREPVLGSAPTGPRVTGPRSLRQAGSRRAQSASGCVPRGRRAARS